MDDYTRRQRERLYDFAHKGELCEYDDTIADGLLTFTRTEAHAVWESILETAREHRKLEAELRDEIDQERQWRRDGEERLNECAREASDLMRDLAAKENELEAWKLRAKTAEAAIDRIIDAAARHTLNDEANEPGDPYFYAERGLRGG